MRNGQIIHRKMAVMAMTSSRTKARRKRSPFWRGMGHDSAPRGGARGGRIGMTVRNAGLAIAGIAAAAIGVAACGGSGGANGTTGGGKAPLTIAVIPKGSTHEHWARVHLGAEKAAAELTAAGTPVQVIWKG